MDLMSDRDADNDPLNITCIPSSWPPAIRESVKVMGTCGHEVWMSPSSFLVQELEDNTKVVCIECAVRMMAQSKNGVQISSWDKPVEKIEGETLIKTEDDIQRAVNEIKDAYMKENDFV